MLTAPSSLWSCGPGDSVFHLCQAADAKTRCPPAGKVVRMIGFYTHFQTRAPSPGEAQEGSKGPLIVLRIPLTLPQASSKQRDHLPPTQGTSLQKQ